MPEGEQVMKPNKIDTLRAQEILYHAMMKMVTECLDRRDPLAFLEIVQACMSAVLSEMVSSAAILEPGGIDKIIKTATDDLAQKLRRDLAERLRDEQKQARH
jgi:hypothetical protein